MKGNILITGASKGIGRACAIYFSRIGFKVFAGFRKEEDGIELSKINNLIIPVKLDVTDRKMLKQAYNQVSLQLKGEGLTALVNNAGEGMAGPLEFLEDSNFRQQLDVNLFGPLAVTQIFLPLIRKCHGRIIMVGSMGSRVAHPLMGAYSASKFALRALTDTFRMELQSCGIFVSMVDPGNTATSIWEKALAETKKIHEALPADGKERYGKAMEHTLNLFANIHQICSPPETVAAVIGRAVLSRHPRRNYLAGKDAHMLVLFSRLLPGNFIDNLLRKNFGLISNEPKPRLSLKSIWQHHFIGSGSHHLRHL